MSEADGRGPAAAASTSLRQAHLAQALRANLRRRKAAERARDDEEDGPSSWTFRPRSFAPHHARAREVGRPGV